MRLSVIAGVAFLLVSLVLRRVTVNRHIRGRLLLSSGLFGLYVLVQLALLRVPLAPATVQQINLVTPLLLAFGLINVVVALSINPWRADRLPDRFPTIVQDALVIALFAVVATAVLRERILATTAVGAVVIGFALQDTLGNLFAGLAIQIEKPFRVGDWVAVGSQLGRVSEITWRATKFRTRAGNFVVVPNSGIAKETITNYSAPTLDVRLQVEVGASYDAPPNVVKSVILEALRGASRISPARSPEVLLAEFADSAINYRVRFWVADFETDEHAKDQARSLIYYAFKRNGIKIPFPIQVQMSQAEADMVPPPAAVNHQALLSAPMFALLSDDERQELVKIARPLLYAAGEFIVREGDAGYSLFVITRGQAMVTLAATDGRVATLGVADVFGEMSLLTGEARSATVSAVTDCEVLEIDVESFRHLVLANPTVLDRVTTATAVRREELERHRGTHAIAAASADARHSLIDRVRQFLRL